MVDEQEPPKRVVKRVVKKTVVRPTSQAAAPVPTMRYGRPVATAGKSSSGKSSSAGPIAKTTVPASPSGKPSTPQQKVKRQAPSINVRAKASGAREFAGRAWWVAADGVTDGARATGTFVSARARTVAAWRLPHLSPYLASIVTGAVVGIVSVLLALLSLAIFESVRGVAAGGGLWGGLTFAGVAVIGVILGESLLRGFGTSSPRLTSVLGVILTIMAMLGLFLDVVDGVAGLVLVPLLTLASYTLAHGLIDVAENAPAELD